MNFMEKVKGLFKKKAKPLHYSFYCNKCGAHGSFATKAEAKAAKKDHYIVKKREVNGVTLTYRVCKLVPLGNNRFARPDLAPTIAKNEQANALRKLEIRLKRIKRQFTIKGGA